jgi:hypothetical protein
MAESADRVRRNVRRSRHTQSLEAATQGNRRVQRIARHEMAVGVEKASGPIDHIGRHRRHVREKPPRQIVDLPSFLPPSGPP